VALGKGLSTAGHRVTLCTSLKFKPFVTAHGLEYAYLNNDLIEFMHSEAGKLVMEKAGNLVKTLWAAARTMPSMGSMARRQIRDSWEATTASKPDLILYHPKAFFAREFAERLDVPCIFAFYLPLYVPTGEFPAMGIPNLHMGPWFNRFSYRVVSKATWWGIGKYANEWRLSNGLPGRSAGKYLERANGEPIPALHAFSKWVIPEPSDWPSTASVTGYWFLDPADEWNPSPELQDFLSRGKPPVYFGFGSIFGSDPSRLTGLVLRAVEEAGVRAIIARGWGGLAPALTQSSKDVLVIESAPHDWLFPKVDAVVHHGGCGTTAAGLRAGRPAIICPLFGDQPFWGKKVEELGAGTPPIAQKKLTVGNLAAAIREVTTNDSIREKAERIGRLIQTEDGVSNAIQFINRFAQDSRPSNLQTGAGAPRP